MRPFSSVPLISPLAALTCALSLILVLSACNTPLNQQDPSQGVSAEVLAESDLALPNLAPTIKTVTRRPALPPPQARTNWSQAAGGARHLTGHAPYSNAPSLAWTFAISGPMRRGRITTSGPLIMGDRAYALSPDLIVYALDLTSGKLVWQQALVDHDGRDGLFGGGLAADNRRLYVSTGAGHLHGLDRISGEIDWTSDLPSPARAGPTLASGVLYVSDLTGQLSAYSLEGAHLWTHESQGASLSTLSPSAPAVSENGIYYVQPNGLVSALLPDGQEGWQFDSASQGPAGDASNIITAARALPVVDHNTLLVSRWANRTLALSTNLGELMWEFPMGATSTPAVTNQFIFMVTKDGALRALERQTGAQIWALDLNQEAQRRSKASWFGPLMAGNRLIVSSTQGILKMIDPASGTITSTLKVGQPIVSDMTLAQNTLLVITRDGLIRAYR